ncbi:MAG: hypothetical protein JXR20_02760 [Balneola sp.]
MKIVHILNGDALKERFPSTIDGGIIVARECLVDGNVTADSLNDLFQIRAAYLDNEESSEQEFYQNKVVPEFEKIIALPKHSTINLWFEDDLFCQVNLWFVSHLIEQFCSSSTVFLVRPHTDIRYGFGGLDSNGLVQAHSEKVKLSSKDINLFSSLWNLYQDKNHAEVVKLSQKESEKFPFLKAAAQANLERFPDDGSLGRPEQTLLKIMTDINSTEFGPVFQEFHKREGIYGFGDLQVMKMFDTLADRT